MSEPTTQHGRRSATRRRGLHPTALIAVVLVLLTIGVLLLVRPQDPAARGQGAEQVPLSASSLTCPTALPGAESAYVSSGVEPRDSDVRVLADEDSERLRLARTEVTTVEPAAGPVIISAEGAAAPGVLGARFGGDALASTECGAPQPETWFTGVGASARHASTIELVNPDAGVALADITVYGGGGPIEVPDLQGVTVQGRQSVRLDLAELVPRRGEMALRVVVARGRLGATVLDRVPELGAQEETSDWLPGQAEPATRSLMLGIPPGAGRDDLVVANPGEDEARVDLRLVTADSAFTPEGLEELRVPPGGVRTVTLTAVMRREVADGALGVEVVSTAPVTASLRSVVDGDLSHATPVVPADQPMTVLVPQGAGSVVLADAEAVGVATVAAWTADGEELETQRLELQPGQGGVVELPEGAAVVQVSPARTSVHAVAMVTGSGGAAVLPFRSRVSSALDPDVRPGLP
jgi:hypothetical protein